jgi:single-strand DNA-binding protein
MNKVQLLGRLTRDPEVRYYNGQDGQQSAVARYTLAVDRPGRHQDGQQSADFISCVAFGKRGEFAGQYFRQGMKVAISGRLQTGSYTDKDGRKVYTTDVNIEEQEFAESRQDGQQMQQAPQQGAGQPRSNLAATSQQAPQQAGGYYQQQAPRQTPGEAWMNIPQGIENDLPFR